MVEIKGCQVTASKYMRELCLMFLADNLLWMIFPIALCGAVGVLVDVRLIIVALMVLFVVLPLILALLYLYYGFSPEAMWSIMEKVAVIDNEGISLSFTDERMKKHAIGWDDVRYIIEKEDVVMLMLRGKRYKCFMLPKSAIDPDVSQALRQFTSQVH